MGQNVLSSDPTHIATTYSHTLPSFYHLMEFFIHLTFCSGTDFSPIRSETAVLFAPLCAPAVL